jgi:hypothetical protein
MLLPASEIIMQEVAESVILKVKPTNPDNSNNSSVAALITAPKVFLILRSDFRCFYPSLTARSIISNQTFLPHHF